MNLFVAKKDGPTNYDLTSMPADSLNIILDFLSPLSMLHLIQTSTFFNKLPKNNHWVNKIAKFRVGNEPIHLPLNNRLQLVKEIEFFFKNFKNAPFTLSVPYSELFLDNTFVNAVLNKKETKINSSSRMFDNFVGTFIHSRESLKRNEEFIINCSKIFAKELSFFLNNCIYIEKDDTSGARHFKVYCGERYRVKFDEDKAERSANKDRAKISQSATQKFFEHINKDLCKNIQFICKIVPYLDIMDYINEPMNYDYNLNFLSIISGHKYTKEFTDEATIRTMKRMIPSSKYQLEEFTSNLQEEIIRKDNEF